MRIGDWTISNRLPITFFAGPCQIESPSLAMGVAERLADIAQRLSLPLVYKASFDKANRSSAHSLRGIGIEKGLQVLADIKAATGLPVMTDIHEPWHAKEAAQAGVDVLQIPALLSRQTNLLIAAAETGHAVNVKKGQFMSPYEVGNIVSKLDWAGCQDWAITERGTLFGYQNLIVDMRGIKIMQEAGAPVIFDATHSVQRPAALGHVSGGDWQYSLPLAKAAVAVGVAGIFFECHPNPRQAASDAAIMLELDEAERFIIELAELDLFIKGKGPCL